MEKDQSPSRWRKGNSRIFFTAVVLYAAERMIKGKIAITRMSSTPNCMAVRAPKKNKANTQLFRKNLYPADSWYRVKRNMPRRKPAMHRNMPKSRSEEHTSELQSRENLVCRLLLEK